MSSRRVVKQIGSLNTVKSVRNVLTTWPYSYMGVNIKKQSYKKEGAKQFTNARC